MPVIGHDNEGPEVYAFVFHRETECRDNDRPCFPIEDRSLWLQ